MQQNSILILSTGPLSASLIKEAKQLNIEIDVLSFIETEPVKSKQVQQSVEQALLESTTVVFTSTKAVETVARMLFEQPDWKIYCIGNTTKQGVEKYFGGASLAGSANSAAELAKLIVAEKNTSRLVFFCGDQRRNELPDILRNNHIDVQEIVVYRTRPVHHKIEKKYYGILFFSPSGAESFFSKNKLPEETTLFAIGNTTAKTLRNKSPNKVITNEEPGKGKLVKKMMEYVLSDTRFRQPDYKKGSINYRSDI